MRRAIKKAGLAVLLPLFMLRMRLADKNASNIEEYLELAYKLRIRSLHIKPYQIRSEVRTLLSEVHSMNPRTVLEIGTARGGTLYLFSRAAAADALLISVDLPGAAFGGGYPIWRMPLYRSFARKYQSIRLIRNDSHDESTLERVEAELDGRTLDVLYIDGDHRYEGVKRDFEMYSQLIGNEGIAVFHDIVPGPENKTGGVPRFWKEVSSRYRHKEIVEDWNQQGFGIGMLLGFDQ